MTRSITIAGGGLAGLTLGIALRRRDVPVSVVEAANYPRHRVCGEFVSGLEETDLRALDLEPIFASAHRHSSTAWFEDNRAWFQARLPTPAYGLSRHVLDAALADKFQTDGGTLQCGQRFQGEGEGIVWANGRAKSSDGWLGIKSHYEHLDLSADLEIHLQNGGYVGLTRVENDRVNVCGLFRRPPQDGSDALASACEGAGLSQLAHRLRAAVPVSGTTKGVTHFSLGWQRVPDDRICVGDAAAMIPPFTGNGMAMAIHGALAAADSIAEWSEGRTTWKEAARRIRLRQKKVFNRRLRWARFLQAVLLRRAGRLLAGTLLASGLLRFETLYAKLR